MYLRTEDYLPHAPDEVGRKVRVNHDSPDCSGESDSMIVERKHDGVYAKCFRCGLSGRYREAIYRYKRPTFDSKPTHGGFSDSLEGAGHHVRLPHDATGVVKEWPSGAKLWVYKAGLTDKEVENYGFVYSHRLGRVLIPIYSDGSMVGYQARKIFPADEGPKYYTRTHDVGAMVWHHHNPVRPDVVVVCEDVLSAIRVGRRWSSVGLLGTSINDSTVGLLTTNYNHVILWLDYDNRIVKEKTIKIKNRLELYISSVHMITNGIDPKNCTDIQIDDEVFLCLS